MGTGTEARTVLVDGNEDGNEDRIGEGGREAKKRMKPQTSCIRLVGNGGDLGGKSKKRKKKKGWSSSLQP